MWFYQTKAEMERECELMRLHLKAARERTQRSLEQYARDRREKQELMDKIDRILSAVEPRAKNTET